MNGLWASNECGTHAYGFLAGHTTRRRYPVRVIVPGHVGVRNVKWVEQIVASAEEAQGPWQRGIAYKGFSPSVKSFEGIDVSAILSMQEMPVQSTIVFPAPPHSSKAKSTGRAPSMTPDFVVEDGDDSVSVKGWAYSGGGRGIARVDVSADGGRTWHTAELGEGSEQNPRRAWAWTFWEIDVPLPTPARAGDPPLELCCRCTDASYNVQPERPEPFWNKRGLNNNAWHRVVVPVVDEAPNKNSH